MAQIQISAGSPRSPDLAQARKFLSILDPRPTAKFSFRTFDDPGDNKQLATKCHGTLDTGIRQSGPKKGNPCRPSSFLRWMNNLGAGVFVMVNETDGVGQDESSIKRVRALFVDCDDDWALAGLSSFIAASGLLPTITVASGGVTTSGAEKQYAYWTIKDCPLGQFKPAQLALHERIGSDPTVHDLPRVMRLPGYWHRKKEPRTTRLVSTDPSRIYDFTSFMGAVKRQPIIAKAPMTVRTGNTVTQAINRPLGARSTFSNSAMNARLRELLRKHGGLVVPAIDALISEAVGPGNRPGNRHETLKTVVGKLGSRAWSADEITTFILPRINQRWGDGDWGEHLASVVDWAVGRDQQRGAVLGAVWGGGTPTAK